MSTVVEIERAIQGLAASEREELEIRLFGHPAMDSLSGEERAGLLAAEDEADAEQGPGLSLTQMQGEVRSWFGK
ncbi:MAG: hypothetical protein NTV93_08960 [Verrucomicrobia bacterium]|nr:hypothetical protein [Verrucomicrobiota bacterium]